MPIPRKRFGQHFLRDEAVIQHILVVIAPQTQDHLVEIGPGQGALTIPMLQRAQQIEAVELDRDLIPLLKKQAQTIGKLIVHEGDALTFNFAELKQDDRPLRLFGNLPYNISTPLIFHLLDFAPIITDMIFMLQKEVAERLAAAVSTPDYGRLSVMVQYHCEVDILFDVAPEAFYPPPQVQSSIVRLLPRQTNLWPALDYALFQLIVKQAFGQRRKTLRNSLKQLMDEQTWERAQISPNLRPENLSVHDFVVLSHALMAKNNHKSDNV